jgi:hypothetical protein
MTTTYQETIKGFKPQFGNANHIAAVPLIDKAAKLQKRLDGYNERAKGQKKQPQPPKAIINELNQIEGRIMSLLRPDAPMSTYPPQNSQV